MYSKLTRRASLATASLFAVSTVAVGVAPAFAGDEPPKHREKPSHVVKHAKLIVKKTADPSWTRTYNWAITKTADKDKVFLKKWQEAKVNYDVSVGADRAKPFTDVFSVSGSIWIKNPSWKQSAKIKSVTDKVDSTTAPVRCGVTLPVRLGPGDALRCSYGPVTLPDGKSRVNTATVTSEDWGTVRTTTATADVKFVKPTKTLDTKVSVKDSRAGFLGVVTAKEAPKTFKYSVTIRPSHKYGKFFILKNVAALTTSDTHKVLTDDALVRVFVLKKQHDWYKDDYKKHDDYKH